MPDPSVAVRRSGTDLGVPAQLEFRSSERRWVFCSAEIYKRMSFLRVKLYEVKFFNGL
jgi:hypothetical protein